MDHASYNIAIIMQQVATEYILFKSVILLNMFRVLSPPNISYVHNR